MLGESKKAFSKEPLHDLWRKEGHDLHNNIRIIKLSCEKFGLDLMLSLDMNSQWVNLLTVFQLIVETATTYK